MLSISPSVSIFVYMRPADLRIHHSTGRSIRFEQDHVGRITALIDPSGHRISDEFDAQGHLFPVTDRAGATTDRTDHPHYLDEIIDSLGCLRR